MHKLNRPLRILHVVLRASAASAPFNEFALALRKKHAISVCTFFKAEISIPEEVKYFEGDGTINGFRQALKRATDAQHYDILHFHYPHPSVIFLLSNLARLRKLLPLTVYTVHSSFPNYKLRNRLLIAPVFMTFRRVVFCSQSSLRSMPTLIRVLAGSRSRVVQNGVDLQRVDQVIGHGSEHAESSAFTVVSVGRLVPVKNPLQIVRAFKLSDDGDSRLTMIGEGPLSAELKAEIGQVGIEPHVLLPGLISREQVYHHMAHADVFISTSYVEGLPIAVLEAMACRCPVVLSDIPSHREIAQGVDFIPLVHPDDAGGFAREIARFRQMSQEERANVGDRCRSLVEERFSLIRMLDEYETLYAELLQE